MEVQTHRKTANRSCEERTGLADNPSDLSVKLNLDSVALTELGFIYADCEKGFVDTVDLISNDEVCRYQIVKHPSCQPHIVACPQVNQKINTIQEGEDRKNQTIIPLYLPGGFPRRHRSKRIINRDNMTTPENADQKATSSASQPHFPGRRRARQKKKRRQKDEETSDPEVVNPSLGRERSKRRVNCDNGIVPQQGKLDSSTFERHLENLWTSFSEEKRSSFMYLDCLWFSLYTKESYKAKVLDWIKKKQIFSKKYVFVPIVRWCHWSLLIFCNFGESPETKSRTPCMLLLDSLQLANPQRLEPEIRKFVLDIYKAEERPEIQKQISRIPLKIPKVPQQRNAEECGNFVLYYINLFIENAPENFSISEGYPYFMKTNWFTPEGLDCFCKRLDSICQ